MFLEDDDYLFMLMTLKGMSYTHNLRIYAFCLMPSHVHILFSPAEENLYDAIFPFLFKKAGRGMRAIRASGINLLGIEELEIKIEEMKRGDLLNKPETRKAKRDLIEQLIARGYKRGEIAGRLGVSRKTIYNLLKLSM